VLIGATAMGFHGLVRATEDLDFSLERLRRMSNDFVRLYRMKKGTVRQKDHVDAAALKERFDLKDEK
jgi:hypothetical protein